MSAREMQGHMYVPVCMDSRISMEAQMHMCRSAAVGVTKIIPSHVVSSCCLCQTVICSTSFAV